MFDAERLLGKIVGEVVGGGAKGGRSGLGGLAAGSGLMTLIGLGVGAFEILKQQGQNGQTAAPGAGQAPPPPPGQTAAGSSAMPPPPPGSVQAPPTPPPIPGSAPAASVTDASMGTLSRQELAVRMIQVMVAAAYADGVMDQDEERAVLEKMRGADLSQEEKMFLLDELHRPRSIEALAAGIVDPSIAKTMYILAVGAIEIDTEAERVWLDQLARRLGLSKELQAFIEEQR